jgi:DNA-binding NtrC family response regulator
MFSNCVLMVEDDPNLGPLVRKVLETNGYRVFSAASTGEALRIWAQTNHGIQVALVDLTLSGQMTGEPLARQLRSDNPSLRVILTSGRMLWPDRPLERLSYFAFLPKPFLPSDLLRLVQRAFANIPVDQSHEPAPGSVPG